MAGVESITLRWQQKPLSQLYHDLIILNVTSANLKIPISMFVFQVNLPAGKVPYQGRVRKRARDLHRNLSGHVHSYFILETRVYEVELGWNCC